MSDADEFDVGAEGAAKAAPDALVRLTDCAEQIATLEATLAEYEEMAYTTKQALQNLKTKTMPDIMIEIGVEAITHDGVEYKLSDFVSGSLPKDPEKRKHAFELLIEEYHAGSLIKTDVSVQFSREQYDDAVKLFKRLHDDEGLPADLSTDIHNQTLLKFARERLEEGLPLDLDALGLYTGKVVKYKTPKAKK